MFVCTSLYRVTLCTVLASVCVLMLCDVLCLVFMLLLLPLGMVCQLKDDAYRLLGSLQQSLLTVVNSVGNIEHSVYPPLLLT